MPKIIKDLDNKLMEEALRQVQQLGYGAMTIRSVASACGVGVGTVYNYYSSKEALVAAFMLRSWSRCMQIISRTANTAREPETVARCIYDQLTAYVRQHQFLFQDEAAAASRSVSLGHYHAMLRDQLAQPLRSFTQSDFAAQFAAEALLYWSMDGRKFEQIYGMLKNCFDVPFP